MKQKMRITTRTRNIKLLARYRNYGVPPLQIVNLVNEFGRNASLGGALRHRSRLGLLLLLFLAGTRHAMVDCRCDKTLV